jgi:hypothetical protein
MTFFRLSSAVIALAQAWPPSWPISIMVFGGCHGEIIITALLAHENGTRPRLISSTCRRQTRRSAYIAASRAAHSYGAEYRSFTEQYFDSSAAFRNAVIAIVAKVAKQERIRTLERVSSGLTAARNKGKRPAGHQSVSASASLPRHGKSWREIAHELSTNPATARRAIAAEAPETDN